MMENEILATEAWKAWEEENKYHPTGINPHAFVMGYNKAKAALSKPLESDPMPDELDYVTGAADASEEVYDQFLKVEYEYDLNEWKKRQAALSKGNWTDEEMIAFARNLMDKRIVLTDELPDYNDWYKNELQLLKAK